MAILDDLEGFLGAEATARIKADPNFTARLTKAGELEEFYYGEGKPPAAEPPPARREPPSATGAPGTETLSAIMAKLDSFGNLDERIANGVKTVVEQRGAELTGNAISSSIAITRELTKIDRKHFAEFGEELDDVKLNAHIDAARKEGRPFRTVSDAYEDMTREARVSKRIASGVDEGVREKLKDRASGNVPGVTPSAATPMLRVLKTAGKGAGEADNHIGKAARALEERLGERNEQVA